nr:hypothetical protein [Tanacetum cinerariifolium]
MVAILEKTEYNTDFHQIVDFLEASHIRRLTRRATRIAQSKALLPAADEPASLLRDDRQREAFPTISSLDTGQDMENIAKTSAMLHDSSPRVTSLDANESSMQQKIHELMKLCTSLQRQQSQMAAKIKDQGLEISGLKTRVKYLEDKERRRADKSIELGSNDTEEMVNVLISMEAVNILSSGGAAASVSPADVFPTAGVPTVSAIFTTSSVEQIDAQVAREMEEEFARENQRLSKHLARDLKIARIHTKEELKIMIEGLDRTNEVIAKHLSEYEQAEADLSVGEKIELIKQKEFYMSVLRSHAGWKTKHFRGMTFEQIKDRSIPVWKKFEDFVPMSSKEKSERVKRQGLKMDQGSSKRVKISEGVSEEERKGMMQNYMQQPIPYPEDITDPTTAMNMALALMAKAFKLNYSTLTNNNQRISSNPRNRQIAQPGMNMGQDRQMQMIGGNGGNQFRQYAGQNAGNLNGYNAVQNVGNQVAQNPRVQNDGIQNQIGNGNLVAVRAEGNTAGHNGNQIRCYNC